MNKNTKAYFTKKVVSALSDVMVDLILDESVSSLELYSAISYTMRILDVIKDETEVDNAADER